jgi:hypothetical protein
MESLNDNDAWRGDIDTAIAMSIRDAGMPLIDPTHDSEAGADSAVKDEPVDEPGEHGKKDAVNDKMYNFHQ